MEKMQLKRTKIVVTIGPASDELDVLASLIKNGANVFRFNLKHNTLEWHKKTIKKLRLEAKKLNINIGVMVDIPRDDYDIGEIKDFDILALSYMKEAGEIDDLRKRCYKHNLFPLIVAKIENKTALNNIEDITRVADGIMVARGDLGNAISFKELAYYQKQIIDTARAYFKPVIVATEMLLSMVTSIEPTRTEATDVANAVYDGADAVMLSQETAIGNHPSLCVKTMNEIVTFSENTGDIRVFQPKLETLADELFIAAAGIVYKSKNNIKGVVVTTKSGRSGFKLASFRIGVPVIAISDNQSILNGLNLGYGLIPIDNNEYNLKKIFKEGESILLLHGKNWLEAGSTNTISIVTV